MYSLFLTDSMVVACCLSIGLSAVDFLEVRVSKALQERVVSLGHWTPSVRCPVPQHEEEVRDPGRVRSRQRKKRGDDHLVWELPASSAASAY